MEFTADTMAGETPRDCLDESARDDAPLIPFPCLAFLPCQPDSRLPSISELFNSVRVSQAAQKPTTHDPAVVAACLSACL